MPHMVVGTWRLCGWSYVSPSRRSAATPRRRSLSERAQAPCASASSATRCTSSTAFTDPLTYPWKEAKRYALIKAHFLINHRGRPEWDLMTPSPTRQTSAPVRWTQPW